jgi:phage portal protein BeeE
MLQTKSELLYTIAYQLHKYRNALVKIIRAEDARQNIVLALEPLNCDDYLFGEGYEINDGLYLKLKEKATGKVILLDYNDVIHLRLNPNDIFFGDRNDGVDLTNFVKIFDENLSALLNELKNAGEINGVVEIGGPLGMAGGLNAALTKDANKISKQQEIINRIKATSGGILVLDSGEKWTSLSKTFKTMSTDDLDNMMKYLYNFKGINQAVIDGTATEAAMNVFFNKTIMPLLERLIEQLNYKFLDQESRKRGQLIEYFKNPFEYMATKDLLSNMYLGAMFLTQNEGRRYGFRLPPLPGGDELLDNKNFTKTRRRLPPGAGGDDNGTEDN